MSKRTLIIATPLLVLALSASFLASQIPRSSQEQTEWLTQSLKEIQTIKVGMTRADLLKVFTTEGGLSTGLNRTYVFRGCNLIKVDVEFDPVGRAARNSEGRVTLVEANEDVIKKISKPYLDWSVVD